MRKFVIGLIIFGFLIAFMSQALAEDTYIVKSGDTLSGIAEKTFGDYKKWKELAEINGLEITKIIIDGQEYDHVLIIPGQVLKLKQYREMTMRDANDILTSLLENRIKMFRHPQYDSACEAVNVVIIYEEQLRNLPINEGYSLIRTVSELVGKIRIAYKDYEALTIQEQLISASLPSMPPDSLPEDIVEKVLQTMALLEIESGYNNIRGSHGEIGWYQVKPDTWIYYSNVLAERLSPEIDTLFENTSDMMEENFYHATAWIGWLMRFLIETEDGYFRAMKRYNNGSEREAYAHKINKRFLHLKALFDKAWQKRGEVYG